MDFQYIPEKIANVVEDINKLYFLPHIQRELVWNTKQITKLFDSLMRNYPINVFLFWKIDDRFVHEITKLEFIRDYKKGEKSKENSELTKKEYRLVLDGQQRLHAFFIALKGSYQGKELYFNILSDPKSEEKDDDSEDGEESGVVYEFEFYKKGLSDFWDNENKLWVKVKDFGLLSNENNSSERRTLQEFKAELRKKYENKLIVKQSNLMERNIDELNRLLTKTNIIFYYLEEEPNYNKVLDIFIRANSGGAELSKSDLLFSIIKLKWKNVVALEEFKELGYCKILIIPSFSSE